MIFLIKKKCIRNKFKKKKKKKKNTKGKMLTMISAAVLFFVTITALVLSQKPSNLIVGKRHDVYIAGFFPYDRNVTESEIGRGVMPAVKLAVDHINENPSVLRNYLLHMWWNDTKVRNLTVYSFISISIASSWCT